MLAEHPDGILDADVLGQRARALLKISQDATSALQKGKYFERVATKIARRYPPFGSLAVRSGPIPVASPPRSRSLRGGPSSFQAEGPANSRTAGAPAYPTHPESATDWRVVRVVKSMRRVMVRV